MQPIGVPASAWPAPPLLYILKLSTVNVLTLGNISLTHQEVRIIYDVRPVRNKLTVRVAFRLRRCA
jgi:hypothetical protein